MNLLSTDRGSDFLIYFFSFNLYTALVELVSVPIAESKSLSRHHTAAGQDSEHNPYLLPSPRSFRCLLCP